MKMYEGVWRGVVSYTPQTLYSKCIRYPLDSRLGGPQESAHDIEEKLSACRKSNIGRPASSPPPPLDIGNKLFRTSQK
jgi:hypothetical protein